MREIEKSLLENHTIVARKINKWMLKLAGKFKKNDIFTQPQISPPKYLVITKEKSNFTVEKHGK